MKIAIFTNNYLPNPFGVAGSIESFRKEFEKLGHTVYIFAPHFKNYKDTNPNVFRYPSIDFTMKGVYFPIAIPFSFKMNKILKDLKIDIIHSQHPNLLGWQAKHWAKKKNIPLIFTWHTLYDQYTHFFPLIPEKISIWWVIRNAANYANSVDYVIAPTHSVKKIISKWGVKNPNNVAIPTGVDEQRFADADGEKIRKKYNISKNKIVLTLVSRITDEKNILFLMCSVVEALKKNEALIFLIKGKGSLMIELEKIKQESGKIGERIIFADDEDLPKDVFAAGDVFVYASKSETQGMVISEAMYMGLPIVAVRATGVWDLVTHQYNGLLVEEDQQKFVDAILKLTLDDKMRKLFSDNAKKIAKENYAASVCAKKMLEVYAKVISHRKSVIG